MHIVLLLGEFSLLSGEEFSLLSGEEFSLLSGESHLTLSHAAATVTYICASKWVLMSILQKSCVQKVPISYNYILGWQSKNTF